MKSIYTLKLILSMMAGTLQPVLPMVEYMLNHHDFSRLLRVDVLKSEGVVCVLQCTLTSIQKECDMDHS